MTAPFPSSAPSVLAETDAARVTVMAPRARLSLRVRGELAALNGALGLTLPGRIGARTATGGLEALRLGPDEWMLHCAEDAAAPVIEAAASVYEAHPHSLVDVSGREVSFLIEGPRAAELLTLGCPRDIDAIAVGEGRRTLFDGATVILWRDGEAAFRMDVWNSFAAHLAHLLEIGCRELAAEAAS
ncbi:sarcosine oxidase subunit gamma [Roseibacterium sp. SDUM158017]|uniref:sarcosine oxidase subunit gamma n=1 Tax=Roseicyclus salinarum TaxID=3036773 RepID=UPI002414FE61|nr:sarcosine oxidase subunit gamma [Roseibacterium sp. SDUM158017]MDG4650058.1 sarcosine oxidase subunit gamma [Roseibacterium sp. SDUM158017]